MPSPQLHRHLWTERIRDEIAHRPFCKNSLSSSYATAAQSTECMRQLRNAREGRLKIAPHHSRPVIHGTSLRTTCSATHVRFAQLVREHAGPGFSVAHTSIIDSEQIR